MQLQSIVNFVPDVSQDGFKVLSPATGKVDKIDNTLAFAQAFSHIGEGVAIKLEGQTICSPISGHITEYVPSFGKVVIQAKNKMRFLLQLSHQHIELQGLGIKPKVAVGQMVEAGQELYQIDLYKIKLQLKPVVLYFLLLDYQRFKAIEASKRQVEMAQDPAFVLLPK